MPELRRLCDVTIDELEAHWLAQVLDLMEKAEAEVHSCSRFKSVIP